MNTTKHNIQRLLSSNLDLASQREVLTAQSYSNAFPSSFAASAARAYAIAVLEFDMAHPEILRAIKIEEEKKAEIRRREVDDLGWI